MVNENLENNSRPEDYEHYMARYKRLHKGGFSGTKALGKEFVDKRNELIGRAEVNILKPAESELLADMNKKFIQTMDEFEKTHTT